MNPPNWLAACSELLSQRRDRAQMRSRQIVTSIDATHVQIEQTRYINFSSNDYLGLTHHPKVRQAVLAAAATTAVGSGAAGLISGYTPQHALCEQRIAAWKQTQQAVLLPSGYQANVAAVQTLSAIGKSYSAGARFLVDKLAHASIIDAVRATDQPMRIFPHNNLQKLRRLLDESDPAQLQIVVTESIFSMDGDASDLRGIAGLKEAHPFVLMLDEAHGSGVYGPAGAGVAAEMGLQEMVDVTIVTLSKAAGCAGGAVCGSSLFCEALVNFGRAYIYSTSIPPLLPVSIVAAIDVMRDEPWRQERVRKLAKRVREAHGTQACNIPAGDSPIIPVMLGSEQSALTAAKILQSQGLLVVAVRPPTVAPKSSRLRITVSCEHTDAEIDQLINALKTIGQKP